jgi:hypothetical protein
MKIETFSQSCEIQETQSAEIRELTLAELEQIGGGYRPGVGTIGQPPGQKD